ncbi:hypothetical protein YPPY88_0633, partial [Yersinia pestis PY-88]
MLWPFIR